MPKTSEAVQLPSPAAPVEPRPRVTKLRSPSYPGINLDDAIKRAQVIYDKEKRNAVNVKVAAEHWSMSVKSSGALIAIAALKSFGLVRDEDEGQNRKIQLTELALRILLDTRPDSEERAAAVKRAALGPKIHADLWREYGAELPSDSNLEHALIFDHKFNPSAVGDFVREYKETIAFARLNSSDTLSQDPEDSAEQEQCLDEGAPTMEAGRQTVPSPVAPGVASATQKQAAGQPVGASIPVSPECNMTVVASGRVTQKGIDTFIAYLNLIRPSFPEGESGK
jgi:hypothetical protein